MATIITGALVGLSEFIYELFDRVPNWTGGGLSLGLGQTTAHWEEHYSRDQIKKLWAQKVIDNAQKNNKLDVLQTAKEYSEQQIAKDPSQRERILQAAAHYSKKLLQPPGYEYLGPGTDLSKAGKPVNDLDKAAEEHDNAYANPNIDTASADQVFVDNAHKAGGVMGHLSETAIRAKMMVDKHIVNTDPFFRPEQQEEIKKGKKGWPDANAIRHEQAIQRRIDKGYTRSQAIAELDAEKRRRGQSKSTLDRPHVAKGPKYQRVEGPDLDPINVDQPPVPDQGGGAILDALHDPDSPVDLYSGPSGPRNKGVGKGAGSSRGSNTTSGSKNWGVPPKQDGNLEAIKQYQKEQSAQKTLDSWLKKKPPKQGGDPPIDPDEGGAEEPEPEMEVDVQGGGGGAGPIHSGKGRPLYLRNKRFLPGEPASYDFERVFQQYLPFRGDINKDKIVSYSAGAEDTVATRQYGIDGDWYIIHYNALQAYMLPAQFQMLKLMHSTITIEEIGIHIREFQVFERNTNAGSESYGPIGHIPWRVFVDVDGILGAFQISEGSMPNANMWRERMDKGSTGIGVERGSTLKRLSRIEITHLVKRGLVEMTKPLDGNADVPAAISNEYTTTGIHANFDLETCPGILYARKNVGEEFKFSLPVNRTMHLQMPAIGGANWGSIVGRTRQNSMTNSDRIWKIHQMFTDNYPGPIVRTYQTHMPRKETYEQLATVDVDSRKVNAYATYGLDMHGQSKTGGTGLPLICIGREDITTIGSITYEAKFDLALSMKVKGSGNPYRPHPYFIEQQTYTNLTSAANNRRPPAENAHIIPDDTIDWQSVAANTPNINPAVFRGNMGPPKERNIRMADTMSRDQIDEIYGKAATTLNDVYLWNLPHRKQAGGADGDPENPVIGTRYGGNEIPSDRRTQNIDQYNEQTYQEAVI